MDRRRSTRALRGRCCRGRPLSLPPLRRRPADNGAAQGALRVRRVFSHLFFSKTQNPEKRPDAGSAGAAGDAGRALVVVKQRSAGVNSATPFAQEAF